MNFFLDGLNPLGFSEEMDPGLLPWKMYFSDFGIESNVFGGSRKFSPKTDFGVCAISESIQIDHLALRVEDGGYLQQNEPIQSVSKKVDSSEKLPSSKISKNSVPFGLNP